MDRQDLKARIALMLRSKELDESALENLSQQELLAAIGVYHQELIHQNEELKLGEEKLAAAENRYEELFKDAPLGYVVFDQDLKIHSANPAFCQLLEAQSKTLAGQSLIPFIHPGSQDQFSLSLQELYQKGKAEIGELNLASTARVLTVHCSSSLLPGEGAPLIRSAMLDITAQKQAQEEIRQSNQRMNELANNSSDIFWVADPALGKNVYISPAFETVAGVSYEVVMRLPFGFLGIVLPEDWHILSEAHQRENSGEHSDVEYRIRRPDGSIRWLRDKSSPVFDENGKVVRVVGVARDITDQVLANEKLKDSEIRFRQMAENIQEVFWMFDNQQQTMLYVSPAYEAVWGRSMQDLYRDSRQYIEAIHPDDRPAMFSALVKQAHGEKTEMEYRVIRPDGSLRWIYDRSFPIFNAQNVLARTTGIATDMTERKLAEQERQARQALLEKVIQLGKKVTAIASLPACLLESYRVIREELGFDRVGLFLYDQASDTVRGVHGTDRQGQRESLEGYCERVDDAPHWRYILQSPLGLEWIDDYQALYNMPPDHTMYGVKEHVTVAAWAGDRPIGLISVDNLLSQRAIKPSDLEVLQLFAGYVGLAIANAQLNASLEQRVIERTEELRQSEMQNRLLFEEIPDPVYLLDPGGRIVRANHAYAALTKIPLEEMLGKTPLELGLISDETRRALRAPFRQAATIQNETFSTVEYPLQCRDGSRREVESRLFGLKIGSSDQILVTTRDITAQKQTEAIMRRANSELERSLRLKDEFLASMSHELRTPLNGILGLAEALQMGVYSQLTERQLKAVGSVEKSGQHLLNLINDILDLSKVEAGKVLLDLQAVDVYDLCQASLLLIDEIANKKRQGISLSVNPIGMVIKADPRRVKQILVNLLSNAVKFTPEGGALGLDVNGDALAGVVRFSVWDKGIGIAAEDMEKLFKPFIQLDSSLARKYEGAGLGLSLAQRLAELHGGSIALESVPGQGSRFTVIIPWQTPDQFDPSDFIAQVVSTDTTPFVESPSPEEFAPDQTTVLLAEDNEINIELVSDYLSSRGYRVLVARNGIEALEMTIHACPQLILMDIQMPGMDGVQATRSIRRLPDQALASIPIIAVTALAMPGDRERCIAAGVNDYLSKPLNLGELTLAMQKLLGNH